MIDKTKMWLGTGVAAGAAGIACFASLDNVVLLPASIPIALVCMKWGACRRRRPMPDAWFNERKT